jgi:hypothetical protein
MVGSSHRGSIHPPPNSRRLRPADFSFHDFGELRRDELRKISRLGIRGDPPSVSVIEDAIVIPDEQESDAHLPKGLGGIVMPDGQPIESAQLLRKGGKHVAGMTEPISIAVERELDENVLYLGPLFNHYGRVLLESLARIWYLSEVDPSTKVVFSHAQELLAPWVFKLLSVFGIPPERILTIDKPTRIQRAIVPEPLFEQLYSAHVDMVRPFREVAARIAADVSPTEQPLYLSRRRLTSGQRQVVGETELEDILRHSGFAIAYPETMSIEDQIRLVNGHSDIFSSLGSAAHSILFALDGPRLHLLANRENVPANYFLCSALAGVPTTFINCLGWGARASRKLERLRRGQESSRDLGQTPPGDTVLGPQAAPQLVELDRVVGYLQEKGFITSQSPAAMLGPDYAARLQRRYDEAWFYTRLRKTISRKTSRKTEPLPVDLERDALELAAESWPVSFMLTLHYLRAGDSSCADTMANQFAALVDEESDFDRLAYYRGDVHRLAKQIVRASNRETARRIRTILADHFSMQRHDEWRSRAPTRATRKLPVV